MSWTIEEAGAHGPRAITNGTKRIRLLTEEHIKGMNLDNTKAALRVVMDENENIHAGGTPQAIQACDYMRHALRRQRTSLEDRERPRPGC